MGKNDIAETIAEHLEKSSWNNEKAIGREKEISDRKIIETEEQYNIEQPTLTEMNITIKRLKRTKACGPDEVPIEMIKELNSETRKKLHLLICDWWNNETMMSEETKARVVTIFKKGDTSDISKSRPISLLNST